MADVASVEVTATGYSVFPLTIVKGEDGLAYKRTTVIQNKSEHSKPWRYPLHTVEGGVGQDRLNGRQTYSKANMDLSNEGIMVPPALVTNITLVGATIGAIATLGLDYEFAYSRHAYGMVPYLGADVSVSFLEIKRLGDYEYIITTRGVYQMGANYNVTKIKDFGTGVATDAEVFNGELIISMGATEGMWRYVPSTNTWTQSADVFGIALGLVEDKLWVAVNTNEVINCITGPLTLSNYSPATGNEYAVGDTTYAIQDIIEYAGVPWVEKADGVYAPDARSKFHNQVPQKLNWPNNSADKSMFKAEGYLWAASNTGLHKIGIGSAPTRGPEGTNRPSFRFKSMSGAPLGNDFFVLCKDESGVSPDTLFLAKRVGEDAYVYHEWLQMPVSGNGIVRVTTLTSQPSLLIGIGNNLYYVKLGRGGGRHIDDTAYAFGTIFSWESGIFQPLEDMTLKALLVGVEVVLDVDASESITFTAAVDGGSFSNLLTTQEGGGTAAIASLSGYDSVVRYAPIDTVGQFLNIRLSGTLDSGLGSDRPEIREIWAFGYSISQQADAIQISCIGSGKAAVNGLMSGIDLEELTRRFTKFAKDGTIIALAIPGYESSRTLRFKVDTVEQAFNNTLKSGGNTLPEGTVTLTLLRVDYAGAYASVA